MLSLTPDIDAPAVAHQEVENNLYCFASRLLFCITRNILALMLVVYLGSQPSLLATVLAAMALSTLHSSFRRAHLATFYAPGMQQCVCGRPVSSYSHVVKVNLLRHLAAAASCDARSIIAACTLDHKSSGSYLAVLLDFECRPRS